MSRLNLPRLTYGIELETHCGGIRGPLGDFKRKRDGSIEGWEYVSPILRGRAGLRRVKNFMRRGRGIVVNRSCGYHLHIGMDTLNDKQRYRVYAAYLGATARWKAKVTPSRQNNTFANNVDINDRLVQVAASLRMGREYVTFVDYFNRYEWVNPSAIYRHGTIENRLHQGTWNFRKVARWVGLNLHFVRLASQSRQLGSLLTTRLPIDRISRIIQESTSLFDQAEYKTSKTFPEWSPCWPLTNADNVVQFNERELVLH